MRPVSHSYFSDRTFECSRTSHCALQMFILASCYPTGPASLTLAAKSIRKKRETRLLYKGNFCVFQTTRILDDQLDLRIRRCAKCRNPTPKKMCRRGVNSVQGCETALINDVFQQLKNISGVYLSM